MDRYVEYCFVSIFMVCWVVGAVLAKGFWSTLITIFFFPWAFYLVVEKLLINLGWLV